MVPVARDAAKFNKAFEAGKYYRLDEAKERTLESHNLYFAAVAYAWENLPEQRATNEAVYRELFATDDHWRQFCLIKAGFRHEIVQVFDTAIDAQRSASIQARTAKARGEEFVITTATDNVLTVYIARTQRMLRSGNGGMDKTDFEASKDAVLEISAHTIKIGVDQLVAEAKRRMR